MTWREAFVVAAVIALAPALSPSLLQAQVESQSPSQPMADGRRPTISPAALDQRTREVASELRCPVCQGESIQESPSPLAQEMKGVVREQLAAGKTPDEVKAYFVARYGEWILLRPSADGVNVLLYWLPPLVLVAGIGIVLVVARRWTRASTTATPTASPPMSDV